MELIKKIAVLGSTGKSGKYLVRQALDQSFLLKVLLRNPDNLQVSNQNIEIIKGDARDYRSVHSLVQGCQAVISTLGQPKNEPPIFSQATTHVLRALKECKIQRYILVTGLNVDTPFDEKSVKTKFATDWMKTNFPATTSDKQLEYEILSASEVEWTLVRLPLIELTDERKEMRTSLKDCPGEKISATDLAHFVIRHLSDERYCRKSPFIANV